MIEYIKMGRERELDKNNTIEKDVRDIIDRVKSKGDEALRYFSKKYDGHDLDDMRVSKKDIELDGSVAVENLLWHPAIEWSDGGDVYVRLLEHMSDEEIQANTRTPDVEDDVAHLHDMVDSTIVQIPSAW